MNPKPIIFATFGLVMTWVGTVAVSAGSVAGLGALGIGMVYMWLAVRTGGAS